MEMIYIMDCFDDVEVEESHEILLQSVRSHQNYHPRMPVRIEERKANSSVGGKRQSKRIFEGEVLNRAHTLLLLDVILEDDKVCQSLSNGKSVMATRNQSVEKLNLLSDEL